MLVETLVVLPVVPMPSTTHGINERGGEGGWPEERGEGGEEELALEQRQWTRAGRMPPETDPPIRTFPLSCHILHVHRMILMDHLDHW